jgi:hypothetical protein
MGARLSTRNTVGWGSLEVATGDARLSGRARRWAANPGTEKSGVVGGKKTV